MIANPDLKPVWPKLTGWRGAGSTRLARPRNLLGRRGALNTLTNGYTTPNNRIPDLVMHHTGYFGPRSWHVGAPTC